MKAELKKEKDGKVYEYKTIRVDVPRGWVVCKRWARCRECAPSFDIDVFARGVRKKEKICGWVPPKYRWGEYYEEGDGCVKIKIRRKKKFARFLEEL